MKRLKAVCIGTTTDSTGTFRQWSFSQDDVVPSAPIVITELTDNPPSFTVGKDYHLELRRVQPNNARVIKGSTE